jgi:hypothetical protein
MTSGSMEVKNGARSYSTQPPLNSTAMQIQSPMAYQMHHHHHAMANQT